MKYAISLGLEYVRLEINQLIYTTRLLILSALITLQLEDQRQQLLTEFEAERRNHQRLIRENARLEQRYQNLQDELEIIERSPVKTPFTGQLDISASSSGRRSICEGVSSRKWLGRNKYMLRAFLRPAVQPGGVYVMDILKATLTQNLATQKQKICFASVRNGKC